MYGYQNYMNMQPQINRLGQLENQFAGQFQQMQQPQMQPQQTQMQQQIAQNSVIPVGGIEEVRAYNNYFDGQAHYFIDNASNKIYIKQLGLNGIPSISTYKLDTEPLATTNSTTGDFVSKEEFNALKSEIEQYKGMFNNFLGGNTNVQSNADTTNDSRG